MRQVMIAFEAMCSQLECKTCSYRKWKENYGCKAVFAYRYGLREGREQGKEEAELMAAEIEDGK